MRVRFLDMLVLLLVVLLPATATAASPSVEASVDPSVVDIGGTTTLELRANVEGNRQINLVEKPEVGSAFRVVGTSRRPQLVVRNGRAQRSLTVRFQLRAVREGTYDVSPGAIEIGGNTYEPDPRQIRVVPSGARSSDDNNDETGSQARSRDGDILVDTSLEPSTKPYLGQQITVVYALLANPRKANVQPRPPDEPSLDNFWIEELSREMAGNTEMTRYDGRVMEKTVLRAYALFPLESGTITIDPLTVQVRTGGFFSRTSTLDLQTDPVELNVRALPPDPPEGFYEGNVGDWSFRVDVQQSEARVGDSIRVELRASGRGNIRRLELPSLEKRLEGFHVSNRSEKVDKEIRGTRVAGRKTVTYTLVPTREGTLQLPSLNFSYFDPDSGEYQTEESRPRTLRVQGGALPESLRSKGQNKKTSEAAEDEEDDEALLENLRAPIRQRAADRAADTATARLVFYIAAGLPLGGLAFLFVVLPLTRRLRRSESSRRHRSAVDDARARLDEAERAAADDAVESVYDALRLALVEGIGLPPGALSPGELEPHLREIGCEASLRDEFAEILQWCENKRYTPTSKLDPAEIEAWVARARDAINELDRARTSGALSSMSNLGFAALAVWLLVAAGPSPAAAEESTDQPTAFDAALKAHDNEQWSAATKRWKRLLDESPDDPVLLHNYALSLIQTDRLGEARIALERAALLAPTHPAIRAHATSLRRLLSVRRIERSRGMNAAPAMERDLGWWNAATAVPVRYLAIGLVVALWLIFLGALGRSLSSTDRIRFGSTATAVVGLVAVLVVGAGWLARWQIRTGTDVAVVTDAKPVRQAPSKHADRRDVSPPLIDGVMVRVRERRGDWIQFRTPGDQTAWLPAAAVTTIERSD